MAVNLTENLEECPMKFCEIEGKDMTGWSVVSIDHVLGYECSGLQEETAVNSGMQHVFCAM